MARKFSSRSSRLLPPEVWDLIRKRLHQFSGFLIICIGILTLLSIASYNPADGSWNTASGVNLLNWFRYPGAVIADILLQSFGIGSFMVIFSLFVWGGLLMIEGSLSRPLTKLILLIIALALASMALTAVPTRRWFFDLQNIGGIFGSVLLTILVKLIPLQFKSAIQIVSAALCGVIYAAALGLNLHQWSRVFKRIHLIGSSIHNAGSWIASHLLRRPFKPQLSSQTEEPLILTKAVLRADVTDRTVTSGAGASMAIPIKTSLYEETNYSEDAIDQYEESLVNQAPKPRGAKANTSYSVDDYQLPAIDLLDIQTKKISKNISDEQLQSYAAQLEQVLSEFGVRGEIVGVCPGPVVTLYELKPAAGIKTSRVIGLADDIARSMSAHSARIAVIPGRNVIGIELPNPTRETVYMRDLLLSEDYQKHSASLAMILGKDIGGNPIIADLARMPHLLVAGTTGSGKSVSVNTMILSLLYRLSPDQCKFIMIDPKMLEFSVYDGIPHLLTPVVTDSKKAVVALKWAVREMESRYRAMSKLGVRNIDGYNARIQEARQSGEILMRRVQTGFDPDTGKPIFENQSLDVTPLPYIVIVVDEMADLMLVAGKEIEAAVQRLAQMARAAGIHLIMATQRPSVDVITGTIKANFPTRISFMVTSKIDSRTILGEQGAEQLLGQGDMLYMVGGGRLLRVHGPFVKDTEVERIVQFLKTQGEPSYIDSVTEDDGEFSTPNGPEAEGGDALYQQAVELVRREGKASTSFVQRHLQIGYNRAARMIEQMEKEGLISPANHVGKREVIG
ncbi:MAG: DNA translocase FtsK 4TM domain-containing protein [Candidatus Paracaedibacteraceae bacterium]|nr:DNA translocase FtsK 4TM domain-containing protein [Candidatus Paracaedibacteraceae bacterium]